MSPPPPAVRRVPTLPSWIPAERSLVAMLVLILALSAAIGSGEGATDGGSSDGRSPGAGEAALVAPTNAVTPTQTQGPEPTPTQHVEARPTAPPAAPTATLVAGLDLTPPAAGGQTGSDSPVLPNYRIVSYYGHPLNDTMGIVGELSKDELLTKLRDVAAAYAAADPTRAVMPAIEVISSVAQDWPADDDTYLLHTGRDILEEYADFCEENGLLLILDLQIGHSTVEAEIEKIRPLLERPFVHLALDPEFAMAEGEVPGSAIGGIDAADITAAQETLADIADEHGLPPKILIVHQFTEEMIRDAEQLAPLPGVQLVIEFDGFGEPANKIEGYTIFISERPIEYGGIKLFYRQDDPLLTPQEILALEPAPDLVIYQ